MVAYPESLWSKHYKDGIIVLPGYELVGETKNEAAENLREQIPEFTKHDVKLRFVCGHAVAGTFVTDVLFRRFLSREYPGVMTALQNTCIRRKLPTVEDMAKATAHSVLDTDRPSGDTIYVLGEGEWGYFENDQAVRDYIDFVNQEFAQFDFER